MYDSYFEITILFNPLTHDRQRRRVCYCKTSLYINSWCYRFSLGLKTILLSYASRAAYRHSGIFNIFQLKRCHFKRYKNEVKIDIKKTCKCLFWEEFDAFSARPHEYTDDSQEIYFMSCNKVYLEVGNVW